MWIIIAYFPQKSKYLPQEEGTTYAKVVPSLSFRLQGPNQSCNQDSDPENCQGDDQVSFEPVTEGGEDQLLLELGLAVGLEHEGEPVPPIIRTGVSPILE